MNRKFVLFIVEGKNDKTEIEALLRTSYFDRFRDLYVPWVHPTHGDLATDLKVSSNNILEKLNQILKRFRDGIDGPYRGIKIQDIHEIIQIVDTDGVFIPESSIVYGENSSYTYGDDSIITSNINGAIGRNRKKAGILRKLISVRQIGNIPYRIYFASCNMDHLLFDKRMSSGFEKNLNSEAFQTMCEKHPDQVIESIFNSTLTLSDDYSQSWEEIQSGCQSLQRHTNINIFFNNYTSKDA